MRKFTLPYYSGRVYRFLDFFTLGILFGCVHMLIGLLVTRRIHNLF